MSSFDVFFMGFAMGATIGLGFGLYINRKYSTINLSSVAYQTSELSKHRFLVNYYEQLLNKKKCY